MEITGKDGRGSAKFESLLKCVSPERERERGGGNFSFNILNSL